MLDAMLPAGPVERMAAPHGGWTRSVLGQVGELDAVVCKHGVDFVGNSLDQVVEESPGGGNRRLPHQPSEGVLRGAVHSHEEVELALLSADRGDVDVEGADRIGLERLFGRLVTGDLGQAADPMALQATMQG